MAKTNWQKLYNEYSEAYDKQAKKTPMDPKLDYRLFKTYYLGEKKDAKEKTNPSNLIHRMVRGQRDVLSPKQMNALFRNAPGVFDEYVDEELTNFFEETGWLLLESPEERYLWGQRHGSALKRLLTTREVTLWDNFFNS